MQLPKIALSNFRFTSLVLILLMANGISSFMSMPRMEDPTLDSPGVLIYTIYPGASAKDIEEQVIEPLEDALSSVTDMHRVITTIWDGVAMIVMDYEWGVDVDEKFAQIVREVNRVRPQLPDEVYAIDLEEVSMEAVNIYQLAFVSDDMPFEQMEGYAKRLKKKIQAVKGVRLSEVHAVPERQVNVSVDIDKLAQMKIPLTQVMGFVQASNQLLPGGSINIGKRSFDVETNSKFENLRDIRETIIHSNAGKIVRLDDVADIELGTADEKYIARYNGKRCIFLTAQQKPGTNIFEIDKKVKPVVDKFTESLPENLVIETCFDQTESVDFRVGYFFQNLVTGVLLIGVIIAFIVGFRPATIIMISVPFSIVIGLGFVDMSGYGLQQMTIAGLIVALGLLVDFAIVVTENIARFIELGHSPLDAAIKGTQQVGWPIVSSASTTILAFIPLMFIQDVSGDFIKSLPLTVIFTIIASLGIGLAIAPFIASKFLTAKSFEHKTFIQRFLQRLIEGPYRKTLAWALEHPKKSLVFAILFFVVAVMQVERVGFSYFPLAEKPYFMVDVHAPRGTSIQETDNIARYVEKVVQEYDYVKSFTSNVGTGNPQFYYNVFPPKEAPNFAQIIVSLKGRDLGKTEEVLNDLRNRFADYPDADIEVVEIAHGPTIEAPIVIRLLGEDLRVLKTIAKDVEGMIRSVPGTDKVENDLNFNKTNLEVAINKSKASMLGVPMSEINRTIRTAIAGVPVSKFTDNSGQSYDIVFRLPFEDQLSYEDFDKIYVNSLSQANIPLKQLANIQFNSVPSKIQHYDKQRSVTVLSHVEQGANVNNVTTEIVKKIEKFDFPDGYGFYVAGEKEAQGDSFAGIGRSAMIALICVFAILVLQFSSFAQPMIIFSALPFAMIGSIFALLITGYNFSFTALIGLVSLIGIVVNDSIILVEFTNQLRKEGKDLLTALKEAGEIRFVPIILTTLTTIAGLLPLTIKGGTLWAPMGWTIIGGLSLSTFLILIIVPVLYKLFSSDKLEGTNESEEPLLKSI